MDNDTLSELFADSGRRQFWINLGEILIARLTNGRVSGIPTFA